jgi:hypothetical protein
MTWVCGDELVEATLQRPLYQADDPIPMIRIATTARTGNGKPRSSARPYSFGMASLDLRRFLRIRQLRPAQCVLNNGNSLLDVTQRDRSEEGARVVGEGLAFLWLQNPNQLL